MIFPVWNFNDYSPAPSDLQMSDEVTTAEAVVEGSGTRGAPVGCATAIHILGTKEDFHNLDETISKGPMPPVGLLMHLVRPTEYGFEILDVWSQARDAEAFYKDRLYPLLQQLGLPFTRTGESEIWAIAST